VSSFAHFSYAHPGVCQLLAALVARGYAVAYVTARPLTGAVGIGRTRHLLFEITKEPENYRCRPPLGPIFTSKLGTMAALREEISGEAKFGKIARMQRLNQLFAPPPRSPAPPSSNGGFPSPASLGTPLNGVGSPSGLGSGVEGAGAPVSPTGSPAPARGGLYCGFGNRLKDVQAYREVGIADNRNFLVNSQGGVHVVAELDPNALLGGISPTKGHARLRWQQQWPRVAAPAKGVTLASRGFQHARGHLAQRHVASTRPPCQQPRRRWLQRRQRRQRILRRRIVR